MSVVPIADRAKFPVEETADYSYESVLFAAGENLDDFAVSWWWLWVVIRSSLWSGVREVAKGVFLEASSGAGVRCVPRVSWGAEPTLDAHCLDEAEQQMGEFSGVHLIGDVIPTGDVYVVIRKITDTPEETAPRCVSLGENCRREVGASGLGEEVRTFFDPLGGLRETARSDARPASLSSSCSFDCPGFRAQSPVFLSVLVFSSSSREC